MKQKGNGNDTAVPAGFLTRRMAFTGWSLSDLIGLFLVSPCFYCFTGCYWELLGFTACYWVY